MDGELRAATWEQALATAAGGLQRLRDAGRPLGVLCSGRASNEESFLALALARSGLRTPHLDAPLRPHWDELWRGRRRPAAGEALAAVEHADLVLLLEDDLSVSHPRAALAVLRALRRGARLVTVGWQATPLSALAAESVFFDASDPLSTLAGLRHDPALGPLLRAARRPVFLLAPFAAEPPLLRRAAALVEELAEELASAEGAEPRVLPLPTRTNTRGSLELGVAPDRLPGGRPLSDAALRAALGALWGPGACWDEGLDAEAMPAAVSGLVVVGEDLPAVHSDPAGVRQRLGALEQLVVLDAFLTETAAAADVVLPIAAFGEYAGTVTGLEGRVQALQPLAEAPAGARQGWEALAGLLEALGSAFRPGSLVDVQLAIAAAVPGYAALGGPQPEEGWNAAVAAPEPAPAGGNGHLATAPAPPPEAVAPSAGAPEGAPGEAAKPSRRLRLRRVGAFDWGQDPLVRFSPTLRRDAASRDRRFPHGLVVMSASDAGELGVRDGWMLRLKTARGEARVAASVRADLQPGALLVPFAFREQLGPVLGAEGVAEVEVQPA